MLKAMWDERLFVLRARDPVAPQTIRFWCKLRIEMGENTLTDPQIVDALACAELMERERQP